MGVWLESNETAFAVEESDGVAVKLKRVVHSWFHLTVSELGDVEDLVKRASERNGVNSFTVVNGEEGVTAVVPYG